MRIKIDKSGFALWLSANDTYNWAHRPGKAWPCSTVRGRRVALFVDMTGLVEFTVNGRDGVDVDSAELSAMLSDFVRDVLPRDHPAYHIAVSV